jgi:hypothetical protein
MALDEETMLDLSNMITYDLRIKFDPLVFALRRKADATLVDKMKGDLAGALSQLGGHAQQLEMLKRMLEAAGRGMWNTKPEVVAKLRELFAEMDDELEGVK